MNILSLDCPVNLDIGFQFYPKNGIWSRKVYYDIMIACMKDPILADVQPASSCEGGWSWSPTEENSRYWNRYMKYDTDRQWERQIRTYGVSKTITGDKDWRETFPNMKDFYDPIELEEFYVKGKTYLPCITCRAKYFPQFRLMTAFMKVIESLGHTILSYHGFKWDYKITGEYILQFRKTNKLIAAPVLKKIIAESSQCKDRIFTEDELNKLSQVD